MTDQATRRRNAKGTHLQVGVAGSAQHAESRVVADLLRALRLARGLTQTAMAERGLSYKYYQRIEAGRANLTLRTLARVLRALGVPFHELFRVPRDIARRRRRAAPRR